MQREKEVTKKKTIKESIASIQEAIFSAEQILNSDKSTKFEKQAASRSLRSSKFVLKRLKAIK